jgi:hypothetical protein
MRVLRFLIRQLGTACVLVVASAGASSLPGKTELRIEVRQPDGAQAILARSLDAQEERAFGISNGSDERPEALGAPLPPQPPANAEYPPGASQLEFVQKRGVWVRTTTFKRDDDGNWLLASDVLDNPRDRTTLSKPLVGTIRPVQ